MNNKNISYYNGFKISEKKILADPMLSRGQNYCVIALLYRKCCLKATMLHAKISSNWQLRHGYDWLVAMRSSWPFRWSTCGPIRLAGLHSVKHESVRLRKRAPFQKMSNCYDRSLLELYCLEESWQRLTHVLQLTGIMICIQMLVQINNMCGS